MRKLETLLKEIHPLKVVGSIEKTISKKDPKNETLILESISIAVFTISLCAKITSVKNKTDSGYSVTITENNGEKYDLNFGAGGDDDDDLF